MAEGDEHNVYGYRTEQDFDRAAKATRWAEAGMRSPLDPRSAEWTHRPMEVTVLVQSRETVDGYEYGKGKFVYYDWDDDEWVEGDECYAYGLNDESLETGKRYHGRLVHFFDEVGVVEVTVGGAPASDGWIPMRATAKNGVHPNFLYSLWEVELTFNNAGEPIVWRNKSGGRAVTYGGIRIPTPALPTPDGEPETHKPLPFHVGETDGEIVLARPSPSLTGWWEITPWSELVSFDYKTMVVDLNWNAENCTLTPVKKRVRFSAENIHIEDMSSL